MIVNADDYRVNIQSISKMFEAKPSYKEKVEHIGPIAVATMVPILVVCQYMGEIYGFTPELEDKMDKLKYFYKVTELRGCKHI